MLVGTPCLEHSVIASTLIWLPVHVSFTHCTLHRMYSRYMQPIHAADTCSIVQYTVHTHTHTHTAQHCVAQHSTGQQIYRMHNTAQFSTHCAQAVAPMKAANRVEVRVCMVCRAGPQSGAGSHLGPVFSRHCSGAWTSWHRQVDLSSNLFDRVSISKHVACQNFMSCDQVSARCLQW